MQVPANSICCVRNEGMKCSFTSQKANPEQRSDAVPVQQQITRYSVGTSNAVPNRSVTSRLNAAIHLKRLCDDPHAFCVVHNCGEGTCCAAPTPQLNSGYCFLREGKIQRDRSFLPTFLPLQRGFTTKTPEPALLDLREKGYLPPKRSFRPI
jgi:hypothetical protein